MRILITLCILVAFGAEHPSSSQMMDVMENTLLLQNIVRKIDNISQKFTDLESKLGSLEETVKENVINASKGIYCSDLEGKLGSLEETIKENITDSTEIYFNETLKELSEIKETQHTLVTKLDELNREHYARLMGRVLLFVTDAMSWYAGNAYCQSLPGTLVKIDSVDIKNNIVNHIFKNDLPRSDYWVDGNDIETEGEFVFYDKSPVVMGPPLWANQQPNDYNGQDCVVLYKEEWALQDDECKEENNFICELTV